MSDQPQQMSVGGIVSAILRHRRFISTVLAVFVLGTVALSLLMPRTYAARATLLPPVQASRALPGLDDRDMPLGLLGMQDQSIATAKLFVQILRSRMVLEGVVRSQNLLEWYGLEREPEPVALERAVAYLGVNSDFAVNQAGIILVTVRFATGWFPGGDDRVRQRAADVANELVAQLDRVNREKSLSRAKQTRLYLERQLSESEANIRNLSVELAEFRRQHGAVALDAQTRALVANGAELQSRLLAKEVELGLAARTMTPDNPAEIRLRQEIDELRKGLNGLQGPSGGQANMGGGTWMDLPVSQIPDLQYRLARYERDLSTQVLLQAGLNQQYYQAKIQEASDAPTVQVLDPAVPPQERFSPKRKLMTVASGISGALVGLLGAAALEAWRSSRSRQNVA